MDSVTYFLPLIPTLTLQSDLFCDNGLDSAFLPYSEHRGKLSVEGTGGTLKEGKGSSSQLL